jgi:hypothetical protein
MKNKKYKLNLELTEGEIVALSRFNSIRYYGGQYDLIYKPWAGMNRSSDIEMDLAYSFKKIAKKVRSKYKVKYKK